MVDVRIRNPQFSKQKTNVVDVDRREKERKRIRKFQRGQKKSRHKGANRAIYEILRTTQR